MLFYLQSSNQQNHLTVAGTHTYCTLHSISTLAGRSGAGGGGVRMAKSVGAGRAERSRRWTGSRRRQGAVAGSLQAGFSMAKSSLNYLSLWEITMRLYTETTYSSDLASAAPCIP